MNELTIKIDAPALAAAIDHLASALADGGAFPRIGAEHPAKDAPPAVPAAAPAPASAGPSAPANAAAPSLPATAPTVPPVPPVPAAAVPTVPTAPPPGYTAEQLGRAGAALIAADPGKREQLIALLQQFGVQTIQALPPEQYGAFATALRGSGAKI